MFTEMSQERHGLARRSSTSTRRAGTRYQEVREFGDLKGYSLTPKFVFIDGRTGAQLYTEAFHEEVALPLDPEHPGAVVLLRADGQAAAGFLNTLSTQKIRGTRILLK